MPTSETSLKGIVRMEGYALLRGLAGTAVEVPRRYEGNSQFHNGKQHNRAYPVRLLTLGFTVFSRAL